MKLKILFASLIVLFPLLVKAQKEPKLDDFGRIVLNTYLPEISKLTSEAKSLLETKLNQITSNYGISGSEVNPRFIITASVNIGTKDIIAGPPQMIAQNIEVTIFIGDAIENKIFSNTVLNLKGVGTNENKGFIDAIKKINTKNQDMNSFIDDAKSKIIKFYVAQCDFILKDALSLRKLGRYNEAIYKLSVVPDVCKECYFRCLDTLNIIYLEKINEDGKLNLQQAKTIWAANLNKEGAEKAGKLLIQISPGASCQNEVETFIRSVTEKLEADAKAQWEFEMKQYGDKVTREKELLIMHNEQAQRNFELDKIRTYAYREIAVEYARNQPTIVYRNIYWY